MRGLDQDRTIVLSLKPRFAEGILAADRTVELRRTAPRIVVPMAELRLKLADGGYRDVATVLASGDVQVR